MIPRPRPSQMDTTITAAFAPGVAAAFHNAPEPFRSVYDRELGALVRHDVPSDDVVLDVTFRDLTLPPTAVYMGHDCAHGDGRFFLLDGMAAAHVQLAELGTGRVEIAVSRDFDPVRLLGYVVEPLLRLLAIRRGVLFLHASSVSLEGRGVAFPAWGHTGKTNIMLALTTRHSAAFLADDWSILTRGASLEVNPRHVNLFDYNLARFPDIARLLPRGTRTQVLAAARAKRLLRRTARAFPRARKGLELSQIVLDRLANARLAPARLNALGSSVATPHAATIVLLRTRGDASPTLQAGSVDETARRMQAVFEFEHTKLAQYYQAFRFATGADPSLRALYDAYGALLRHYLSRAPIYYLHVGSGVEPEHLATEIASFMRGEGADRQDRERR
jgi:hypothetical protein